MDIFGPFEFIGLSFLKVLESQNSYRGMQFLSQQHVSQEPNSREAYISQRRRGRRA